MTPEPSAVEREVLKALAPLLGPRRVLLIGEWHGTKEIPGLVAAIVHEVARSGTDVVVGLELPMSEDLASGAEGAFWHRAPEFQDGRSSAAMADLVSQLHRFEPSDGQGRLVPVAMDGPWVAPGSPIPLELMGHLEADRDQTMSQNLMAVLDAHPKAFTVVLAGGEHTRVCAPGGGRLANLGGIISGWYPGAVALLVRSSGGTAWALSAATGQGGPEPVPDSAEFEPGAQWSDRPGDDGHHGYLHLGPVSASTPANLRSANRSSEEHPES